MQNIIKKTAAGAVMGGALLFTGGMGLAQCGSRCRLQDGLVNLAVGDVTILEDRERRRRGHTSPLPSAMWLDVGSVNVLADGRSTCGDEPSDVDLHRAGRRTSLCVQNGPAHPEQAPVAQATRRTPTRAETGNQLVDADPHRPYPRGTGGEPV